MFINKDKLKAAASNFGIDLTEQMLEKFDIYADFLAEYNKNVNLTAITDPEGIAVKHFEDSLALLKYADLNGKKIADIGTGAGFPSVPILIAGRDINMTMIEATNKKLVFISELLKRLDLNAELVHMRGEEAGKKDIYREKFDIVTARAVAELRTLSEYCIPLVKKNGRFFAMKSALAEEEMQNAGNAVKVLGGSTENVFNYSLSNGDTRCIIEIKKISQTSPKYPRASAVITKKPL